jgi:signal transduction histidine kinase
MSPSAQSSRGLAEVGGFGFAVVVAVALVTAFDEKLPILFSRPVDRWLVQFISLFVMNLGTGLAIVIAAVWVRRRFPTPGRAQYVAAFVGVTIATTLAILATFLWSLGATLGMDKPDWSLGGFLLALASNVIQCGILGLVITAAWLYTRIETDHAAAVAQCAVDSARMDEQAAEARLQMLEAQIEPHFLFNTLAHVKRLYDTEREAGARMLDNLMAYLAVALPQMRATESTLGRELDHARAYLEIQQIRMGRRLAFGIDVAGPLRAARLPPLMLLTLVENAIKHGLTPQVGGGRVDIRAAVEGGQLRVEVADTGQGFTKSGGGGTGLANIRARLATQFGTNASLALALNAPGGVVATISLPYLPTASLATAK